MGKILEELEAELSEKLLAELPEELLGKFAKELLRKLAKKFLEELLNELHKTFRSVDYNRVIIDFVTHLAQNLLFVTIFDVYVIRFCCNPLVGILKKLLQPGELL